MQPSIHYMVEARFYRRDIGNKLNYLQNGKDLKDVLVHTKSEFRNDSPILAREDAFDHFQSLVDVLYEGLGIEYKTYEQARIDLQKYFNSGNDLEFLNGIKISDDLFNGIYIYVVIDRALSKEDNRGEKILIFITTQLR